VPTAGDVWCAHGTPKVGVGAEVFIDAVELGGTALFGDAFSAVEPILSFIGTVALNAGNFCASPPVYPGDPDPSDLPNFFNDSTRQAVIDKYTTWLKFYAFANFCTCDTFQPPYVAPPAPPVIPTGWPAQPQLCTPQDLTTMLATIRSQLQQVLLLEQLIAARVGPLNYTLGNTHTVSGLVEITVSGIVGVITHALSYAPGVGFSTSDPTRFFDAGTVAFGDSNGWHARTHIWHDPQLFLPAPTGTIKVGIDCQMVTSLEVTELLPVLTSVSLV
jgi:hypothetical protein